MNNTDDKKILRRLYKEKRADIPEKSEKDSAVADILLNSEIISNASVVLMYASFGTELGTDMIIDKLLSRKKTVALPLCGDNGKMTFHVINSISELNTGMYGIREPDKSFPVPDIDRNTVCVVPGLAFTEKGGRLGYGGGYYDRFTAENPDIFTVGLTYEELVVPYLPIMSHDLSVNAVVTEERMVMCNAEKG